MDSCRVVKNLQKMNDYCLQCHRDLGIINAYHGTKCPDCLTYNQRLGAVCARVLNQLEKDLKEKFPGVGSKKIGFKNKI